MAAIYPYTTATAALMATIGINLSVPTRLVDLIVPLSYVVLSSWALFAEIDPVLYTGVMLLAASGYAVPYAVARAVVPTTIVVVASVLDE